MAARLLKELKAFQDGDNKPYTVTLNGDNTNDWTVTLPGPQGSAYEGGSFKLHFVFKNYPFKAPEVSFVTKIFHPSVNEPDGHICIPMLENDKWSPQNRVLTILAQITALLNEPSAESPANPEAGRLLAENPAKFRSTAAEWVNKYAK